MRGRGDVPVGCGLAVRAFFAAQGQAGGCGLVRCVAQAALAGLTAGPVDTGPAVFFSLGQLKIGDDIYIERADGTTVHFKVESMERPAQSDFPTARVYGDIDHAGLRLITCTGIYVRGTQRYTHNLIVYARLVE